MRPLHVTRTLAMVTVVAVCAMSLSLPSANATPTTPEISAKREEAASAQAHLDELQAQLELRTEELAAVTDELQATRGDVAEARATVEQTEREVDEARALLSERAAGIYRTGAVDVLEVLLGTTSFPDFLTRMDLLQRVSRSDASLVASVKQARQDAYVAQQGLERREQDQVLLRQRVEVKRAELQAAIDSQSEYVGGLEAEVARLVADEQARLEREAAERARIAAAAAAARARAVRSDDSREFDGAALGNGHPQVVQLGLGFLGVPYLWGGTTPAGFDCSGLTQYVYREVGVDLPRTSRQQFRAGAPIPPDRFDLLMPGDLVFFGYDGDPTKVHHVGIYAGDGNYLHAPGTGLFVRVDSLTSRIATRGDYVGGCRF